MHFVSRQFLKVNFLALALCFLYSDCLEASSVKTFEYKSSIKKTPYELRYIKIPIFIVKEFEKESVLIKDQKQGIVSERIAIKRSKRDKELLKSIIKRFGYFDGKLKVSVIYYKNKFIIKYEAKLGKRYYITDKNINFEKKEQYDDETLNLFSFLEKHDEVDFLKIENEKNEIINILKSKGHFFASADAPSLDLDENLKTAVLNYYINPGKKVLLSNIIITGNEKVPKKFVSNRAHVKEGTIITSKLVNNIEMNLMETGLFSSVMVSAIKDNEEQKHQKAILDVKVSEALPRVISAGAYYFASEGYSVSINWQNKNFANLAHNIGTIGTIGQKEKSFTFFYNIPDALRKNQRLHVDLSARNYNTKAFDGNKASVTVGIVQSIRKPDFVVDFSFLPTLEHCKLSRKASYEQSIAGFKTNLNLNFSNHRLYPTSGIIINFGLDQYFGKFARIVPATENTAEYTDVNTKVNSMSILTGSLYSYLPLTKKMDENNNRTIIAAFLKVGSILIKDLEFIPFDKRFYGGGRNSIRSYGYQMSGELESDGTPIGGSSIFEGCIEPRFRISKDFNFVVFLDYSCISDTKSPIFYKEGKTMYGGGFGLRYHTKFGPIRFDLGFPFKRRVDINKQKIDKAVQFYISVGHAF